jgi:predicted anti-sigma-YlaC factor YlaD
MHQTIQDGLEDFLADACDRVERARIEAHLQQCAECRHEVDMMKEMAGLFETLRSSDAPVPSPGFSAGVTALIERQRSESFWIGFLEPVFGRRLALASLLVLAMLGTVLMSRETEYATGPSPEMILAAEQDAPLPMMEPGQMLYTLATHKQ